MSAVFVPSWTLKSRELRVVTSSIVKSYLTLTLIIAVVQQQPVAPPPFSE
jgi:hypothetical protein